MGVPDEEARAQYVCFISHPLTLLNHVRRILRVQSSKLRQGDDFNYIAIATPGYVGADLAALTGAAGIVTVKRISK